MMKPDMVVNTETPVPIGTDEWGKPVTYDFALMSSHVLITGVTRSGKSSLEYGLLSELAAYPFVRVLGCDPSGLLLAPFAQRGDLVAVGDAIDTHVRVLEQCVDIMESRLARLVESTWDDQISMFTTNLTPLIIVVIEEHIMLMGLARSYDMMTSPRRRSEARIRSLLFRLLTGSSKCGMRVILSMQRPDADIIGGAARSQIETRFLLRSEVDGIRMSMPELDDGQRVRLAHAQPGVGYYNAPGVAPTLFRSTPIDYRTYVDRIADLGRPDPLPTWST